MDDKKKENKPYVICIVVLLVLVVLLVKEVITNKHMRFKTCLLDNYYSIEHIVNAMRQELGDDAYEDSSDVQFVYKNFDQYVYHLIMDDVNKNEDENIQHYNRYLNSIKAQSIKEQLNSHKESVVSELEEDVCYIRLPDFTKGKSYEEVLKYQDIITGNSRFIIDLRGNLGGSVDELIDIFSLFYDKDTLVYKEIANNKDVVEKKTSKDKVIDWDKIIFLCDESTASCAEVLIYNMSSDFPDRIKVVGEKTYGKYFSYTFKEFSDGEAMLFVTNIMCNSEGETFDANGIIPDYEIEGEDALNYAKELLLN